MSGDLRAIERYSNWCSIDRLDGVDLRDGEELLVKWPNGQHEVIVIKVRTGSFQVSDHGHSYDAHESLACFVTDYCGVRAEVPLVGVLAKRMK